MHSTSTRKDIPELNVSKLEVGMVVNNYAEMCRLLEESPCDSRGNAKKAQLSRWERYFEWQKDGQKFVITDIYDNPLPELLNKNSIYANLMQLALMKYLSNQPKGYYHFFTGKLMKTVGMTGNKYTELRNGVDNYRSVFSEEREGDGEYITLNGVKTTARITFNRMLRILDDALKSLENHGIIYYRRVWAVKTLPWDEDGGFRSATKEEELLIGEAEQYAMEKLKTTNKWYAYAYNGRRMGTYISIYLHEKNAGLYGAAKWIEIAYPNQSKRYWDRVVRRVTEDLLKEDPSKEMETLTDAVVVDLCKERLNNLVVDAVIEEANKTFRKAQDKIQRENEGEVVRYNREETQYLASPLFMQEYVYLVNRYISMKDSTDAELMDNNEDEENFCELVI